MAIKVELSSKPVLQASAPALAILVFEGALAKQKHFSVVDEAVDGTLSEHLTEAEFTGGAGQLVELASLGKLSARRVIVVGLGAQRAFDTAALRQNLAPAVRAAVDASSAALAVSCPAQIKGAFVRAAGEAVGLGAYRFTKYLTGERAPRRSLTHVTLYRAGKATPAEQRALDLGLRVADAVALARDAVNEPPNELTPAVMARWAQRLAKQANMQCKVLDKAGIKKAGMKLHYAVGQGSANEPRLIHLEYKPARAKKKIVFVGKGLTFDSGGLCIKPAAGMGEMKSDMGGAAAVLGLMAAVAETRPDVEIHAVIGAAENMPDANAYRPGDVFGSLDGKTVEIINTDAEGRLVLADALTYARQLAPDLIIDAATLTGACVVALGKLCSAFYTADEKLAKRFETAARVAGESFWRMPLAEELREQLNSDVADLKHTGERWGGSITAALFLREFVGDVPWIHCDVAAPVLFDRARGMYPKGGTGHPVLTFLGFVEAFK
jgi:leucyl aminopeptidase